MAIFPGAISTDSDLYIAVNNLSALLTDNPLTIGATTVNVNSTTLFPNVGFISIDAEIIKYTGKTATSFTGCTRGADGTSAASHLLGAQVDFNVIAAHHNVIKDEVIAIEQNLSDRIGLSATQLLTPLGSAGAPSYSFTGDSNTGIYSSAANAVSIATAGTLKFQINETAITGVLSYRNIDGTAATPAYSFSSDSDTGLFKDAANRLQVTLGGTEVFRWGTAQVSSTVVFVAPDGSVSSPAYQGTTSSNTGMYFSAANQVDFATAGVQRFTIASSGLLTSLGKHEFTDGTSALPSISFTSDPDTGVFRNAANQIGFAAGGSLVAAITGAGLFIVGIVSLSDGTTAAPSYTFTSDADKGFYSRDAVSVAFSNASREAAVFTGNGQGGQNSVGAFNLNTGTPSTANIARLTAQTGIGDGDAFVSLTADGASFHMGRDVSDGSAVSFGMSGTVGSNQVARATTTSGFQIKGTTTNDNATALWVGESVESIISADTNAPTSGNYGDLTSISLTAGDWDVSLQGSWNSSASTWTVARIGVSVNSGNDSTGLTTGDTEFADQHASSSTTPLLVGQCVTNKRFSLSATTTVYFKYRANYSAGTPTLRGTIRARRVR